LEIYFLLSSVFLSAIGQLILKHAVSEMGEIDFALKNLMPMLFQLLCNGWIILGTICFAASMILWLKVLSTMELSRAYPIGSLSYIFVFAFSILLFNEEATGIKILGLLCILAGVFLIQT